MLTTKIFEATMASVKTLKEDSPEGFSQAQVIGIAVRKYAEELGYIEVANGIATLGDTLKLSDGTRTGIVGMDGSTVVLSNGHNTDRNTRIIRTAEKVS